MNFKSLHHILRRVGYAVPLITGLSMFGASPGARAQDYTALMSAPDRAEADRQLDQKRKPVELLGFAGPKEGWKVLDLGAGAGYSTEIIARAVGPAGVVYAQSDKPSDKLATRIAALAVKNISPLVHPFDEPVSADIHDLDLVTFFNSYHDTTYMAVDREKMNRAIYAALKPGGYLVITDWSAKSEDGTKVGKSLHRIAEQSLRAEVEAVGFKFVAAADFLRHPEDMRETVIFKSPTPVDEFALKFQKPM
jgi:predicted methyltransferase